MTPNSSTCVQTRNEITIRSGFSIVHKATNSIFLDHYCRPNHFHRKSNPSLILRSRAACDKCNILQIETTKSCYSWIVFDSCVRCQLYLLSIAHEVGDVVHRSLRDFVAPPSFLSAMTETKDQLRACRQTISLDIFRKRKWR